MPSTVRAILALLVLGPMLVAFNCGRTSSSSSEDTDGDGLTDAVEITIGTDRLDPDTDDDGCLDGADPNPLVLDPLEVPPEQWAEDGSDGVTVSWGEHPGCVDHFEVCHASFPWNVFSTCETVSSDTRSWLDDDLSIGQLRAYWVKAVNTELVSAEPDGDYSDPDNQRLPVWGARVAPGTPVSPRFTAQSGDGALTVDWQESGDPAVTDYRISVYSNGAVPELPPFQPPDQEADVPADGTTQLVVDGLENGEVYFVRVRAMGVGIESQVEAAHQEAVRVALSGAGPPPSPQNLQLTQASGYHFELVWDPGLADQVEDFAGYRVRRRTAPGAAPVVVADPVEASLSVPVRPGEEAWFSVTTRDSEGLESPELGPALALAPTFLLAERTLVVWDTTHGDGNGDGTNDSEEVARYYQARRGVPESHMLGVAATPDRRYAADDWPLFEQEILAPIRQRIQQLGVEQVYYIALMYGIPLYADTQQLSGNTSLDTWIEIALDAPASAPANALGAAGSTDFELDQDRHLRASVDLPPSVNDIDNTWPEETMLFDHTVKRSFEGSDVDMFLTSRVDGFDARRAKEMVEASLYAERHLSPAAGHYHGEAYLDRGDLPLGVSLGSPGPMGDFNSDGDPDEAGFFADGDSDDIDEATIRAIYPNGGFFGFRERDLNWAFMRLFFEDRGWDTYTESTVHEIGESSSAWADPVTEATTPAANGTPTLVQWAMSSYNNLKYVDAWTWAVGAVAHDRGSYTFWHPKDPIGTLPDWTANASDAVTSLPSFGCNALFRGAAAYAHGASECGNCVRADVLFGLLLEGHPWADAAARAQISGGLSHAFGDPLYRPFPPGKVPELDTVAPPPPQHRVTDETVDPASPAVAIHWSIEPPASDPDLAIASLEYGTTPALGIVVPADDAAFGVHHLGGRFDLTGLTPDQLYHYQLTLTDPGGNVTQSPIATFTAAGPANLLANGGFELDTDEDGVPDGWSAAGSPGHLPAQLVLNGGFEVDANQDGTPDGWAPGGVWSSDGSESATGLAAYRTDGADLVFPGAGVPLLETGQEFRLTGQVRRQGPGTAELRIGIDWQAPAAVASPAFYATKRSFGTDSNGADRLPLFSEDWMPFTVRGRVPNGAQGIDSVTLGFAPDNPAATGSENWFDDVRLVVANRDASDGFGSATVVGDSDFLSQFVPVANNHEHEVRAKVRRAVPGGSENPRLRIEWITFYGTSNGIETLEIPGVTASEWTEVVLQDRSPLLASLVRVDLLGAAGGSEAFLFDAVSLHDLGL